MKRTSTNFSFFHAKYRNKTAASVDCSRTTRRAKARQRPPPRMSRVSNTTEEKGTHLEFEHVGDIVDRLVLFVLQPLHAHDLVVDRARVVRGASFTLCCWREARVGEPGSSVGRVVVVCLKQRTSQYEKHGQVGKRESTADGGHEKPETRRRTICHLGIIVGVKVDVVVLFV